MIQHQIRSLAPVPVEAWQAVQGQDAELKDVCAWLADYREGLEAAIARDGGVLIRGFNAISDAQSFELGLSALGATLIPIIHAARLRYAMPSAPIDSVKHHSAQSTAPNN